MSMKDMDNETIGSMVAEYRELKEEAACLKVKLNRAQESFQKAARDLDHSILESDWEYNDGATERLADYPPRKECLGWMNGYIEAHRKLDSLARTFKEIGVNVS